MTVLQRVLRVGRDRPPARGRHRGARRDHHRSHRHRCGPRGDPGRRSPRRLRRPGRAGHHPHGRGERRVQPRPRYATRCTRAFAPRSAGGCTDGPPSCSQSCRRTPGAAHRDRPSRGAYRHLRRRARDRPARPEADRACRAGPRTSIPWYERALPLTAPGTPRHADIQGRLARALFLAGRPNDAAEVGQAALVGTAPSPAHDRLVLLVVDALNEVGDITTAVALVDQERAGRRCNARLARPGRQRPRIRGATPGGAEAAFDEAIQLLDDRYARTIGSTPSRTCVSTASWPAATISFLRSGSGCGKRPRTSPSSGGSTPTRR